VADWGNYTIRQIHPNGEVITLAGKALKPGAINGPLLEARFSDPADVALTADGRLVVADSSNRLIRQITPAGEVTTLAGRAGIRGSADGPAESAGFNQPTGVTVGPDGAVFVADCSSHTIRRISPEGTVTTLAGLALSPGRQDGTGQAARFYYPVDLACDGDGNLYVADSGNKRVRKITPDGTVTSLGAIAPYGGYEAWGLLKVGSVEKWHPDWDLLLSSNFGFLYPLGVAINTNGLLYVGDNLGHALWRFSGICPDRPVIDAAIGVVGVSRQLDTAPQTAVSLRWSVIRRPAGSSAQLSAPTIRNPSFAPDVADLYVFELRATNASGAVSVSTLEFQAVEATPPTLCEPAFRNGTFQVSVPTAPGKGYVLECIDSLPGTNWTAFPPVTGDGTLKLLTDPAPIAPQRFYRVRFQ
jgi:sugar lactone lactonase YvrE